MKTCPICDTPYTDQYSTCPVDGVLLIQLQDPAFGRIVRGKYSIVRKLGQGGMGVVYLAEHRLLHGQVALKFLAAELSRNPQFVKRFRNEAQAAYQLRHPNIVEVTDLDLDEDGSLFIAMEYVPGPSLGAALCEAQGPLNVERALHIARGIAGGLAAAHARGAVHRDIKPDNILLAAQPGGGEQAKILDFGIAVITAGVDGHSLTQGLLLTPDYASPEQWRGTPSGELDGRTDLYALGGVIYRMLTGRTPFQAVNPEGWMYQHLQGVPEPLARLRPDLAMQYPGLDAIVMRLLAREREQRFPSANALLDALASPSPAPHQANMVDAPPAVRVPIVPHSAVKTHPETSPAAIEPSTGRTQALWWAVWAALIVAAGLGTWFALKPTHSMPVTAVPVLSPAGGTYPAAQPVAISDATPGASVHYTVNGSAPTMASPVYTEPIASLPNGTMVRAMATAEGHTPSTDVAGVYTWSPLAVEVPVNPAAIPSPPAPQPHSASGSHAKIGVQPVSVPASTTAPAPDLTAEQLRARAYVLMGEQKMKERNYFSAENTFQMAIDLDPENEAAKKGLAAAKKALGD